MGQKWLLGLILIGGMLGAYYSVHRADVPIRKKPIVTSQEQISPASKLSEEEQLTCYLMASLSHLPGQPFPGALPWESLRVIGQNKSHSLEDLLQERPLDFLEASLKRYEKHVQSYRLIFLKRERLCDKLQAPEKLSVCFCEKPFSVHMHWLEGARLAQKSLYVEGENDGKLLAVPNLPFGIAGPIVSRDVDGEDARRSGRYTINQFGLYLATKRVLTSMRKAEKAGTLHLRYEGVVTNVEQVGNRPCHRLVRTPYEPPEEDCINELTLYYDQETLLQVGSVLRNVQGQLIAEYYFRDIEINPTFDPRQFTREGL